MHMISMEQDVANVVFFQGLSPQQIARLAEIARQKRFEKGEAIFAEGGEADGFYAVVSGRVKIFKTSLAGREQTLHIFGPGAPFGEVPVFTGRRFPAHAQALEPSRCLFFPKREFLALIRNEPEMVLNILAVLSQRLHRFTAQIEDLSLKEVPERLAGYLLYLSDQGGSTAVRLDIPKGELANLLGTIPETLSRILSRLVQQEVIRMSGSEIAILDEPRLRSIATGELRV
jgi:CRP/FNR family transcriptional regulator, dissimilatory nitrate respiration regulator